MEMVHEMLRSVAKSIIASLVTPAQLLEATKQSRDTFKSKVLCDSINPDGVRLTTMELTYPRCIHSEFMTHRVFSRNSASSRAIPVTKMLERIEGNPFIPLHWGKNEKGMQAWAEIDMPERLRCFAMWKACNFFGCRIVELMNELKLHKQITNRLIEPWMWITVIASATNWENFFALRCHKDAEPHMQVLAEKTRIAYDESKPAQLAWGDWHLPLFGFDDDDVIAMTDRAKIATGRCARVSYLTHDGRRAPDEDIRLHGQLCEQEPLHASPFEHVGQALDPRTAVKKMYHYGKYSESRVDWGNFDPGWMQYRKMFANENVRERKKDGHVNSFVPAASQGA